jgi:hypothetical protein
MLLIFFTEYDSTATVPSCPLFVAPDFASARIFLRVSALAFELLFAVSLDAVPMRVRVKFFVLAITLGNLVRLDIYIWARESTFEKFLRMPNCAKAVRVIVFV